MRISNDKGANNFYAFDEIAAYIQHIKCHSVMFSDTIEQEPCFRKSVQDIVLFYFIRA